MAEEIWEKEERSESPRGTDLEEKLRSEWRGKVGLRKSVLGMIIERRGFKEDLVFMM